VIIDSATYYRVNPFMTRTLSPLHDGSNISDDFMASPRSRYKRLRFDDSDDDSDIISHSAIDSKPKIVDTTLENDEHHLLCHYLVKGFSLKNKKWRAFRPQYSSNGRANSLQVDFDVDAVEDIKWNTTVFDKLVLPKTLKDTLLAISKSQRKSGKRFDDIIEGKGKTRKSARLVLASLANRNCR